MVDTGISWLPDGAGATGEMAARIRNFDWSSTPLGHADTWSPTLRTMVRIMLANRFPHVLWWGPSYVQFYNDAYCPIPGAKHPDLALGRAASDCWPEIWHVIKPLIDRPFHGGPATWDDDIFLEVDRHGFREECHFTIAYSPVPDDTVASGIGGVLATVHEITDKVIGERRVTVLRDIGTRIAEARTADEACQIAATILGGHDKDVPFALLYLLDADAGVARLAGTAGVAPGAAIAPPEVNVGASPAHGWPLGDVWRHGGQLVEQLATRFGAVPQGPWDDAPDSAFVTTIPAGGMGEPAGFMVLGISARLKWDAHYQDFLELARAQVATAITNARAYEAERMRAETLAELDRAKTTFFSNVSHEFRTPLTLMLGPIEELLTRHAQALPDAAQQELEVVERNGLRLLRLVNSLLDFSRIEAGRMQALYEPVDLPRMTEELASLFRSACERAGLTLSVTCSPLPEPVYVDQGMWEKIVLNLVSNAFKFTHAGGIDVSMRMVDDRVQLRVTDTGTGIPPEELPRVFERFHRVQGTHGRTHEGTGIGLALTQELLKLHGATIAVESTLGKGSTFIVEMPLGKAHLPADRLGKPSDNAASNDARPFVEEALHWLPDASAPGHADDARLLIGEGSREPAVTRSTRPSITNGDAARPWILVVDDNADMRKYLARLLEPEYEVELAADGQAALERVLARQFEMVLTDVMMPRLDGFGLLHALRADARTASLPVIMLSARAGEERLSEGVEAGADDYLFKPFTARELLARVRTHLKMARFRRDALDALREVDRRKDEFLNVLAHELRGPLATLSNTAHIVGSAGKSGAGSDVVREAQDRNDRQLRHLVRLVDDLLDTNRITQGKLELHVERVALQSVIQDAIDMCRPIAEECQRELTLDVPDAPLWIDADPVRLAQVLSNLIGNAYKYTDDGGHVWFGIEQHGDEIVFRVRDDGVGIPADALSSVFDLFVQIRSSRDRARGGLGIGLALVRSLVEMHGGKVQAFSDGPRHGSEFVVRLPRRSGAVLADASIPGTPAEPASVDKMLHVMVVDDDHDSAWSMTVLLETYGYRVTTVHDGIEAMTMAESQRPDVILMDIGLPTISGHEAAQRMRLQPWSQNVMLVAMSGWARDEDHRRSRDAGFDAHLAKPVDIDALLKLLRSRKVATS